MQAFRILLHALRQVFGNMRQALALSAVPLAVGLALGAGLVTVVRLGIAPPGWGGLVTLSLAYGLILVWLAVRWHRFVLLDDRADVFASPPRGPFWGYIATILQSILILVPFTLAAIAVLFVVSQSRSMVLVLVVGAVINLLIVGLSLILGTALAGAAIGAPRPIPTAWKRLKPAGGTLLVLSLAVWIGNGAAEAIAASAAASGVPTLVKVIVTFCHVWLSLLISLSILTTLWGHYVENRPLR